MESPLCISSKSPCRELNGNIMLHRLAYGTAYNHIQYMHSYGHFNHFSELLDWVFVMILIAMS